MEGLSKVKRFAQLHGVSIVQDSGIDFICDYIVEHNVKRILELGTGIGYSSMKFASLADDIFVSTIEFDITRYQQAVKNIHDNDLMDRITIYLGDCMSYDLDQQFDLIFIDAAKAQYTRYFEKFKKNLAPGGVIITDNLSFHGMVNDLSLTHNYSTIKLVKKLKKFIDWLKVNEEFDTQFLEAGDGVSVSKRKGE